MLVLTSAAVYSSHHPHQSSITPAAEPPNALPTDAHWVSPKRARDTDDPRRPKRMRISAHSAQDLAEAVAEAESQLQRPKENNTTVNLSPTKVKVRPELFQPREFALGLRETDPEHVKKLRRAIDSQGELDPPFRRQGWRSQDDGSGIRETKAKSLDCLFHHNHTAACHSALGNLYRLDTPRVSRNTHWRKRSLP
jgi:hypothetical protein